MIPITTETGISTIAFALKEPLDGYGEVTAELAMDSTCRCLIIISFSPKPYRYIGKTNAAAYELYKIFGEVNGQSLPLGFIFTTMTDGSATAGTKQRMLAEALA
jgi:hypothetical protein